MAINPFGLYAIGMGSARDPDVAGKLAAQMYTAGMQQDLLDKYRTDENDIKRQTLEQKQKQMDMMTKALQAYAQQNNLSPADAAMVMAAPEKSFDAIIQSKLGIMSPYQQETINQRKQESQDREAERALREEERKSNRLDSDTQKLSATLDKQGIPELGQSLSTVEDALAAYKGRDIPGYGEIAGQLPDMLISQEGVDLRQQVSRVGNAILKARSGGAVTPQEATRLLRELGVNETANGLTLNARSDKQIVDGMKMVGDTLRERIKNVQGGYSPDVIKAYKDRGGTAFDYMNRDAGSNTTQPRKVIKFSDLP